MHLVWLILKLIKLLQEYKELQEFVSLFKELSAKPAEITKTGKLPYFNFMGLINVNPFMKWDIIASPYR